MKTDEIIDNLVRDSLPEGIYSYTGLVTYAREKKASGIAVSSDKNKKTYILFISGEPDGAVLVDSKGELFGDKAIYLLNGEESFTFYPSDPRIVDRLVLGCRIHTKSHLMRNITDSIPEFGKKTEGVGKVTIAISSRGIPKTGLRVKVRKAGSGVGTDLTNREGKVSFKLMFGRYEIVVPKGEHNVEIYEFDFTPALDRKVLPLELN